MRSIRRLAVPTEVRRRAGLPRGERVLARARGNDDSWLLGTRRFLALVTRTEARLIPWEQVEDAAWDSDSERLRLSEVGEFGEPRPAYLLQLEEPDLLLQLVRERITASIVMQRRVPVRGSRGITLIGRRSPVGGEIRWFHAYDEGIDPDDPEVQAVADAALAEGRREVGEQI